jgi:ankyrin repeat protein
MEAASDEDFEDDGFIRNDVACPLTPFEEACKRGDVAAVKAGLLCGENADGRVFSDDDDFAFDYTPPLLLAAQADSDAVIDLLVCAGADLCWSDVEGTQALHVACERGCVSAASALIAAGAPVNARGKWADTPLHIAASCGIEQWSKGVELHGDPLSIKATYAKLVRLLLAAGASTSTRNEQMKTPLAMACMIGFADAAAMLTLADGGAEWRDNSYERCDPPRALACLCGSWEGGSREAFQEFLDSIAEGHRMCAGPCKKLLRAGPGAGACAACKLSLSSAGSVWYCSRECQAADWKLHKPDCLTYRRWPKAKVTIA